MMTNQLHMGAPMPRLGVPLIGAQEVAAYLGCHIDTARRMLHDKRLPGVKVGRKWIVPTHVLEQWLTAQCHSTEDATHHTGGSRLAEKLADRLAQKIGRRRKSSSRSLPNASGERSGSEIEERPAGTMPLTGT
jgi:excisionase family DNA binding protein